MVSIDEDAYFSHRALHEGAAVTNWTVCATFLPVVSRQGSALSALSGCGLGRVKVTADSDDVGRAFRAFRLMSAGVVERPLDGCP